MKLRSRDHSNGFTLIELMAVMVILTILMGISMKMLDTIQQLIARGNRSIGFESEARTLLSLLSHDMDHFLLNERIDPFPSQGEKALLLFPRMRRGSERETLFLVSYRHDEKTGELTREELSFPNPQMVYQSGEWKGLLKEESGEAELLSRGVAAFDLRFFEREGLPRTSTWNKGRSRMMEVTVVLTKGEAMKALSLTKVEPLSNLFPPPPLAESATESWENRLEKWQAIQVPGYGPLKREDFKIYQKSFWIPERKS